MSTEQIIESESSAFMPTSSGAFMPTSSNAFMPTSTSELSSDFILNQKMSIGSCSIKNNRKINQDSVGELLSIDSLHSIGIVADGHGIYGHIASQTAIKAVIRFFEDKINNMPELLGPLMDDESCVQGRVQVFFDELFTLVHHEVRQAFLNMDDDYVVDPDDIFGIVRDSLNTYVCGGSTLTVTIVSTLIDGSRIVLCANVGDSDTIIVQNTEESALTFEHLTVDHSPDNHSEFERLKNLDPTIFPKKLSLEYEMKPGYILSKDEDIRIFNEDGSTKPVSSGAYHTTVRKDFSMYAKNNHDDINIAMTRAIGDFVIHKYGMTHLPSVKIHKVNTTQDFLIISASDGIWDCVIYEEYVEFVNQQLSSNLQMNASVHSKLADAESLANLLCTEAVKIGTSIFGKNGYDDTTILIIHCL